jgi:putative DNA primase/helicase
MQKLDIATAAAFDSVIWKNKKMPWEDFVSRILNAKVTSETFKEYNDLSKSDKARVKDVGGFFGGYLRNGRRTQSNILHKQLVTLDIDFGHLNFWDAFTMLFDCEAIIHSTHSHSEASPRFRLLIPLNREVTTEEYLAISRKIAGTLGIEHFDNTTFDTNRLMFWPSVSCDVTYYCEMQKGSWLSADDVLASYVDWTDISSWPSNTTNKESKGDKQEDPSEKKGVIGAFCRAYTIEEAIEAFVPDYIEGDNGRYTYKLGSTANGIITYDSKFSYSHHGTDPTSGILCNAFDLVRLHKFGDSQKSFKQMEEFARNDTKTKKAIAKEVLASAKLDFSDDPIPERPEDEDEDASDWMADLEIDARGKYTSSSANINLIFKKDSVIAKLFAYNEFDSRRYVTNTPPWTPKRESLNMQDVDYAGIRNYFDCIYGISNVQKIDDTLSIEFKLNSYNPVRDYLKSLAWDNVKRLDYVLVDYFGVEDSLYHKEAIRKTMVGAVARVFHPGVKFDTMLTLVGPQGIGKSFFINKIGKQWYSDTFMTVKGKDSFEQMQGVWIMEVAELAAMGKADVEATKHFITKQEDIFRPSYHREVEIFKRQCIFIGTTNKDDFLRDTTGNRRFIPVEISSRHNLKNVFTDLEKEVDLLWAEAVHLYKNGERLHMSKEALIEAVVKQDEHTEQDDRMGLILDYLEIRLPDNWAELDLIDRKAFINDRSFKPGTEVREFISTAEIWCEVLNKPKEDMSKYNSRDINELLRGLKDWEKTKSPKVLPIYGIQRCYKRKD